MQKYHQVPKPLIFTESGVNYINESVSQIIDNDPFNWPRIGSQPSNEFETANIIAMSFPELFIIGKSDPIKKVC